MLKNTKKIVNIAKNKRQHLSYFLNILFIIFLGYFFIIKPKNDAAKMQSQIIPPPMEVSVVVAKKDVVKLSIDLPGRVVAHKISEVRPQVEGIIKERNFEEGSLVKKGQQLYQIDPTIYQANFSSASANLKTLRSKSERYKNLLEQDAISKQEYDDLKASLTQAESEFRKAQTNLNYTKVYAPISGYITKSNFTQGALVTANQSEALAIITELDPIYVDMMQASKDVVSFEGEKLKVSLNVGGVDYNDFGLLKFSEVIADTSTDSVRLRAVFGNKNKKLLPGMFVNAKIHLPEIETITIPQRVTSRNPDGTLSLFVVDKENIAKTRIIKEGQITGDSWIVLEGLSEGDLVIYEGYQKISDGVKVNPVIMQDSKSAN